MNKGIIIIVCLLIIGNVYSQSLEEIHDRYNRFNNEIREVYGKDHEKSKSLLDDLIDFYDSIPQENKSDSIGFYCQTNFMYCYIYSSLNEYDKAAECFEKMYSSGCDNLFDIINNDEYSEMRQQKVVQDICEKVKNSAEYKFYLIAKKINETLGNREFEQNIKYIQDALSLYDSLKNKNPEIFCQLNLLMSMLHSALNNKTDAIEFLKTAIEQGCDYEQFITQQDFDNIRASKEFTFLVRDTTLVAPELPPGAWDVEIPDVFSDNTCSALKDGVSENDIDAIANPQFKALAKNIYNNTYDKRYRIREYKPYPNPSDIAAKNKTGTYSLLDNATGIVAMPGEEIVIFVGETNGQNITLCSINFNNDYSPVNYELTEGANSIICQDGGLLYIMYHTENENAKPVKIHIVGGKVNGMYNAAENTNADWKGILDNAKHKYIDVQGEYAHLIFPVKDFKKYTPDISSLLGAFDSIVYLESRFIGLEKYKRMNGNRMLFHVSTLPYWMYADANRTGYSVSTMSRICDVDKLRTIEIWGPAHEVGHVNQTLGLKWVGLTEVSNNIYTMYIQSMFGNKSRLSEDRLNSDFDGVWNNRYEKGFTEMIAGKILHSDHEDVFCKLIPFWQLQLYFSDVKGYTDFYADVHEQIRNMDNLPNDAQQQLNFMRICCDVSNTDLSEFFEKWGMLSVTFGEATDHSSIQNVVNYTKDFIITKKDVDEFKKYVSKYSKPDAFIWYIHDECVDVFKNNAEIEKSEMTVVDAEYQTNTKGVVVFEIYDGDKIVLITPSSNFKIPDDCKNPLVFAVPAVGKRVKLN